MVDPNGRRIGRVTGVLVDRETGVVQWLVVRTRTVPDTRIAVPVRRVSAFGEMLLADLDHRVLRRAPTVRGDALSARAERDLCRFYGLHETRGAQLGAWERRATSARARRRSDGIVWEPAPRGAATSARPS